MLCVFSNLAERVLKSALDLKPLAKKGAVVCFCSCLKNKIPMHFLALTTPGPYKEVMHYFQ